MIYCKVIARDRCNAGLTTLGDVARSPVFQREPTYWSASVEPTETGCGDASPQPLSRGERGCVQGRANSDAKAVTPALQNPPALDFAPPG